MIRNRRGDNIGRILVLEFNDKEINIFNEMMEVVKKHPDFKRYEVRIGYRNVVYYKCKVNARFVQG